MTVSGANKVTARKPLRLWPGVVLAIGICVLRFVMPLFSPDLFVYGVLAAMAGFVGIIIWWLFFSRAPWLDRVGAILTLVVAYFAVSPFLHISVATGFMGRMFPVFAIPGVVGPAFVAWAVATRRLPDGLRRATMVVTILLACAVWTLFRTEGVKGEAGTQLAWRWTKTPEERLLERARDEPKTLPAPAAPSPSQEVAVKPADKPVETAPEEGTAATTKTPPAPVRPAAEDSTATNAKTSSVPDPQFRRAEWPGFRGPARDGVVRGVRIETDWAQKPPMELWRRLIGPGWSSFAVDGDLIYTQEQRGEHEMIACYRRSTGEPVWRHRDAVRFYESNGGPGPRATPTVHNGRVFSLGATAIVNALDARTGARLWSRNAQADTGAPMPGWGFAGSPLVVGDAVIVAASGRLVAYDAATGKPRWVRETGGGGYSSPHLATIGGVTQVLLLSGGGGVTSVVPVDGTILWQHQWTEGVAIVQPALVSDNDVLTSGGDMMGGVGMRRLAVTRASGGWTAQERWTTRGLKPYFNDFVVHKGHAFGFDGTILSCINLEDGERKWKGGRYGAGQMVLLADQDLLLVLSEEGELALVSATPDKHTEVTRFKAIEGKTWNHPVIVGDVLLVRNGEEMAAFRLPLASPLTRRSARINR